MSPHCRRVVALIACSLACSSRPLLAESPAPEVRVESVRRVFHNGEHNAFTDMCSFANRHFLCFRSCPDGHMVHPTSSIIVLASDDGRTWTEVHRFSVPKRDVRDPHFLVFHNQLFIYTGTWYCGDTSPASRDLNEHLGYAAWTGDGRTWHGPALLEGTYGHYVWRAASHGDKAYLCARRKRVFERSTEPEPESVESAMLESDDGLVWRKAALFQEHHGDETAFVFEPDGTVVAVARGGGRTNAVLCRSRAPYAAWERIDLGRQIGGPLLARWSGRWLVGGRKSIGEPRTALYWLVDDKLHEIAELPSGGDNSYPGLLPLGNSRALVSYYSSHERDDKDRPITAIYMADLIVDEE